MMITNFDYHDTIKNIEYNTRLRDINLYSFYNNILSVLRDNNTKMPSHSVDRSKCTHNVSWYTPNELLIVPGIIKREIENNKAVDFELRVDDCKNWLFIDWYVVEK